MLRKSLLTMGLAMMLVVVTGILLEVGARWLFAPLTGEAFDRAALNTWRESRQATLRADLAPAAEPQLLYRFHPYVGYVGRPGQHPWNENYPPFNAFGMLAVPGHDFPYRREPGDLVVAVLGGSVAEGFANLGGEAALQAYLDHQRPDLNRRVVLISLATGGFKQPQGLFHLQTALLSGFEFDVVLNLDGLNELVAVKNNLDRGVHPLYPSSVHTALMAESYQGEAMDATTVQRMAASYSLKKWELWLLSWLETPRWLDTPPLGASAFANLLVRVWSDHSAQRLQHLQVAAAEAAQNAMVADFRGPPFTADTDPYPLAVQLWATSSRLTQAVASAFDLPYLHLLQPNQYVPGSKPLSAEERQIAYVPDSEIAQIVRAGYPLLRTAGAELRAEGIAFYDLTGVFAAETETLYLDICCHFGEDGNRVLAAGIGAVLLTVLDDEQAVTPAP